LRLKQIFSHNFAPTQTQAPHTMGQAGSNPGQGPNRQNKDQKKVDETDCFHLLGSKSNYFLKDDKPKDDKSRFERAPPTRVGKRKRGKGPDPSSKLPTGNF
jgi:hypothetical protein